MIELGTCLGDCNETRPIVNKKHSLCDDCNYKRLHDGKTKMEVAKEKESGVDQSSFNEENLTSYEKYKLSLAKKKAKPQPIKVRLQKVEKEKSSEEVFKKLKSKYSINSISSKSKYTCSDGSKISEMMIKRRYAEVCDKIDIERDPVCQGCGRGDLPLSHSHTISRPHCKELRKSDLIYSEANIEIECYEERGSNPVRCHNIWEDGTWEQKSKLHNFKRKITLMKLHDPQGYMKLPEEFKS